MKNPDIIDYIDYRQFLKDLYELKKSSRSGYSYRKFSEDMGFSASNYLHLIVSGKRNLSHDGIQKVINSMNWSAKRKRYFEYLVMYNQATDQQEKSDHYDELQKILGKNRQLLNPDQYAYFTKWYLPILREIITLKQFEPNLEWIQHILQHNIEKDLIREGLQILARLKMIVKEDGTWVQSDEHLTTPMVVSSELVHNYHREMLELSAKALDLPLEERDVSSMTMSLSKRQFEWLRTRIIEFRDEIQQELQGMDEKAEVVGQLNIQMFAATKRK